MSKFIKLVASAYVNGLLRHPHEGVLHLDNVEAQRLIDNEAGVDVTADFSADDRKDVPVENLSASAPLVSASAEAAAVDHQANVPPVASVPTPEAAPAPAKQQEKSK